MKKSLVLVAMLAFATTLFAETITCESKKGGTCTYELSGETLSKTCTCKDGTTVEGTETATALPTEEECKQEARTVCQSQQDPGQPGQPGSGLTCKNDAGRCSVEEESGNYNCRCSGTQEQKTGTTANISEEGCTAVLEEECGTEAPLLSAICTEKAVFDECASYAKTIANKCSDNPVSDDAIEAMYNAPASGSTAKEISRCCQMEQMRNGMKESSDCINNAAGSCANKECCESCVNNNMPGDPGNPPEPPTDPTDPTDDPVDPTNPGDGDTDSGDTGSDGDTDTANTDAPADDSADSEAPTDGDDSEAPSTDSEPEDQEESKKSDGCSMLFI